MPDPRDPHGEIIGDFSTDQQKWDLKYNQSGYYFGTEPSAFLVEHWQKFPAGGRILDLACGEGRNAVFLASKGFQVVGMDASPVGLDKALRLAASLGTNLCALHADVKTYDLGEATYDGILDFLFLERALFPKIICALKPGGIFVMETYTIEQLPLPKGPACVEYLLQPGELSRLCEGLKVLEYWEGWKVEDEHVGRIVARKSL